ncbi:MAG: hypothetical protein HKN76_10435 [Saprospiraceae bacterium]|nr:hypothetical protein [Saprospiraceae bacterium]
MYTRFTLAAVIICLVSTLAVSQYTILPKPIGEESLVYETERVFHIRAHSNGFSLGYSVGEIQTWYKTKYFYFDLGSLKNSKEYSQNFRFFSSTLGAESSRSFIYGKINRLYALRAGIGNKRFFSEKARRKSIIVGMNYEYGFTLGALKPYYLKLKREDIDRGGLASNSTEKYSEENADVFLDETRIFGGAEFRYGLDEIKLKPGFHGKFGANFSWGNQDNLIKALEVGLMADVFLSKVPLMVTEQNKQYFLNVYLTLQFGKRS